MIQPYSYYSTFSKLGSRLIRNRSGYVNYLSKRCEHQEFTGVVYNNVLPNDHLIVLAERINETAASNELLRIIKLGDPEVNFSKINLEKSYKGLSQCLNTFDNFLTDLENKTLCPGESLIEFLETVENQLFSLDHANNIVSILHMFTGEPFDHPKILKLLQRVKQSRDINYLNVIQEFVHKHVNKGGELTPKERRMLEYHKAHYLDLRVKDSEYNYALSQCNKNIREYLECYRLNLLKSEELFDQTVDDPDILAAVFPRKDGSSDQRPQDRAPYTVTIRDYKRFMELCPDRSLRQNLWETSNKRCSPLVHSRFNNVDTVYNIRSYRRRLSNLLGYRNYFEYKLRNSMAKTKESVLDSIKNINEYNLPKAQERLALLNDFAYDNGFVDDTGAGIQEYDVNYYIYKYKHEVLIGKSESELRSYFPLNSVLVGLYKFFEKYFDIKFTIKQHQDGLVWDKEVHVLDVTRKGNPLGAIYYDPYERGNKLISRTICKFVRGRNHEVGNLPVCLISSSFKRDDKKNLANLSPDEVMRLFQVFGVALERLLYNYERYSLNLIGCFPVEADNLLPNLIASHLVDDQRILQSCGDANSSKKLDSGLASKILTAEKYFKSLEISNSLYLSHFDLELHSNLDDISKMAKNIHKIYSPFVRTRNNYDFCSMFDLFTDQMAAIYYSDLWSRQLANFCLSRVLSQHQVNSLSHIEPETIRASNNELIDLLFDPEDIDIDKKLASFTGRRFEPSKSGLYML